MPQPSYITQSKDSDNELKQSMFHAENARLLSESTVVALWTYARPVVGGFQAGQGKANLVLGAVQKRPESSTKGGGDGAAVHSASGDAWALTVQPTVRSAKGRRAQPVDAQDCVP